MRKSEYALWALLVLAVLAAGSTMVSLARSQSASAANSEIYRQLDLFGEVLERVRSDYVEKPDDSKLIEAAINGMLTALDPHSAYLNPKHFRDMQVQTRGEFGGLGIEVTMENGVVKVVSPIEDTPAARAGLMSGDLITGLDKENIQGLTLQDGALRLTTARYYTPSGRSIQAKGIEPDVVVEEELPDDLKKEADDMSTRGEANLRGHLKIEGVNDADEASQEGSGSSSYVAPDKTKDTQLNYALGLLRGIKSVDTEAKKKAEAN